MKFIFVLFAIIVAITLASSVQAAFEKSDCNLPKDVGPCRKADLTYHYDAESKSCQSFFYGGCHGNNNRFSSQQECEKACL